MRVIFWVNRQPFIINITLTNVLMHNFFQQNKIICFKFTIVIVIIIIVPFLDNCNYAFMVAPSIFNIISSR